MLKKISFFVLAAILFVGCATKKEEDEKKDRNFKDSVYAFINSNPKLMGFGKMDFDAIMKDGNIEENSVFQMFVAPIFEDLKAQVDFASPVYMALEMPEKQGGDPKLFLMTKLKNQKNFEESWTQMGYDFKEYNGISYAEDNDRLFALRNELLMIIITSDNYDSHKEITAAFGYVDGKMASGDLQKQIDASGDFVMHFDVDRLKENDPSLALLPKGLDADISLNFDNGKMVFEATSAKVNKVKDQFKIELTDAPIIAKKITDADGNVIAAMQMRVKSDITDAMNVGADDMEEKMTELSIGLSLFDSALLVSDIEEGDNVIMPESGLAIGGEAAELMIDFDLLSPKIPEYESYLKTLDYASYVMKEDRVRIVVATHESNENFLKTVLKALDTFMMNGGLMQLATMN